MLKKGNLILIAVITPSFLFCQQSYQKNSIAITYTPTIILTPYSQFGIQPGIKYKINDHFSLLGDIAFMARKRNIDSSALQRNFFRIRSEVRYSFPKTIKYFKFYFGLQCSYTFRTFNDLDGGSYINTKMDSTYSYDAARIKSPIFTSSIQMGYELVLNRVSIDLFQGVGIRIINTIYSDLINFAPHTYYTPRSPDGIGPNPAYWYNGNIIRAQYNIGIRLSYYFK